VNLVGSSLGGYFTQYLVAHYPEKVKKAVFANTFPPNKLIAEKNGTIGSLLPVIPAWAVMDVLRKNTEKALYPASGNSELVKAYMMEQSYGMMTKDQFVARFHCVIDPFEPADLEKLGIPVLIIEADNDPLVEPALRKMLKQTYPTASVKTLSGVGHFPYLNEPEGYIAVLRRHFN
jgi:maspardin